MTMLQIAYIKTLNSKPKIRYPNIFNIALKYIFTLTKFEINVKIGIKS